MNRESETAARRNADELRHRSPFTVRENVARLMWSMVQGTIFRFSFPTWYRYRVFLLRLFRAKIDPTCRIKRTVRFDCPWNVTAGRNCALGDHVIVYALGPITLGRRVTVSQYSHLCAGSHDFTHRYLPLIKPPITLENDVWLGADAFVGPGVTVHEGALLGARGSAFKDLDAWTIYGGSPARRIRERPPMHGGDPGRGDEAPAPS